MEIRIRGAREHNLKGVDVDLGDGLTVVTGISGSGKTSLVFDTLYHEARRRLLDVISTSRPGGWRHQLAPAKVESVTGLGPAIAVGQNALNRNPLSTLATASGLHPFLRLLYANLSTRYCACGQELQVHSEDEIVERLQSLASRQSLQVLAPLMCGVPGSHRTLLDLLVRELGPEPILVDGQVWSTRSLDPRQPHDIEVLVGILEDSPAPTQVRGVVQRAAALGAQAVTARGPGLDLTLATAPVCPGCGRWFAKLEPKHFHMPCPYCDGQGCAQCDSTGLHPQAAGARWQGLRLPELLAHTVDEVRGIFGRCELLSSAQRLRVEILRRLDALDLVGLGYIALDRPSPTLSRGEAQRVRLAVALTSQLEDMLHVLDEPTVGQHPADVARFLPAFRELPGPVVFVEHDRVAAASADRAIDLGPGAGAEGGQVVFRGVPASLWRADTLSGRHFSLRERVMAREPLPVPSRFLTVRGAHQHNLKGIDVAFPVGRLTVLTGVSGSGKSTLVEHVLVPSLRSKTGAPSGVGCVAVEGERLKPILVDQAPIGRNPRSNPATYTKLSDIVRELYALATGLTPSHFSFNRPEGACPSCAGMGAVEVRMQYLASVWIPCSDCEGQRFNELVLGTGVTFGGRQLSIADFYQLDIQEAAALLADETRLVPARIRAARRILRALCDVGLGYLPLGQPSPTLSGGEAQRVKLTRYLGRRQLAGQLLVLDEPSTGLHPHDLDGLLVVLDRLVRAGATIIVVEHNTDLIRAADWVIDLGPGAGPAGGHVLYAGPTQGLLEVEASMTGWALREELAVEPRQVPAVAQPRRAGWITIRNARANNLKGVDADIPKGKLTVVTGLSGSGKSSLVGDVLEAEARRRYLESLSMYERQGTREGPEAPVDSVSGLGVTVVAGGQQAHTWSALTHFTRRASVGRASELSYQLATLLARLGERRCSVCSLSMHRIGVQPDEEWLCPNCGAKAPVAQPRHFSTTNYASACDRCTGTGVLFEPQPEKLIIHPEKPLCAGAMYSPGYWPQSYICQDTGFAQALGARYRFDPMTTPWQEMSDRARQVFLFGDTEPLVHTYRSKSTGRLVTSTSRWEGFYGGWVRDWDVHGTYTRSVPCPDCNGAGLRSEYLAVTLAGHNLHELSEMPLARLAAVLAGIEPPAGAEPAAATSLSTARRRLAFLRKVGLGYLHLNRPTGTLSAGEAQRIQLAGLLGSGLTSLTVLLDEPSRGMHPCELEALQEVLLALRDEGNTVVLVEHDLQLIQAADYILDMGPGAGTAGGEIVACGTPEQVRQAETATGRWLRNEAQAGRLALDPRRPVHLQSIGRHRKPLGWLVIRGARAHNLRGDDAQIPLGLLTGVCGVSGSGKSTLLIDTLGRALVRRAHTSSFAQEPLEPGEHDAIEGAPARTVLVDQARRGMRTPAMFLGLSKPLVRLFASSPEAQALGLDGKQLSRPCSACKGQGTQRIEMGFLPDLRVSCETCQGTGYGPEAWQVRLKGLCLPEINALTLDEVHDRFGDEESLARHLQLARAVGLGYLVWHQPAYTLSGGEAQRLKIVKELARKGRRRKGSGGTLYILDEPTVGQHMEDVLQLIQVLRRLVDEGNTVVLIEHHPYVLAACDWLIELGPGGGPGGGQVIASGTPAVLATAETPTAPYLRALLDGGPKAVP